MTLRKSFVGSTIAALTLVGAAALSPANPAHAANPATNVVISGTLQPGFTTDGGNLAVLTAHRGLVAVVTSSSTVVVRRYNGLSAYDELSAGDSVIVSGAMSTTGTMTPTIAALTIKDVTIQKAFTRNYGLITAVTNTNSTLDTITVRVLADRYGASPFRLGESVQLQVSPTMSVTLGNGASSTVAASLAPGEVITSLGIYNRKAHTFGSVSRIHISTPHIGDTSVIYGQVQAGFGTALPTTITLQTPFVAPFNKVTVTLTATSKYVSGYIGSHLTSPLAGYLPRIQVGDTLQVYGTYLGNSSYSALSVRDLRLG